MLRGFYDPRTRHITINNKLGDTQKLSTLIHEMSHDLIGHSPDSQKSSAQREFEADALSTMLEQQYGIPTTDVRKSHLADCYAAYCKELQDTQKPIEIDKLFEPVNDAFNRHVRNLEQYLQAAGIIQKPQELLIYCVRTIEQDKAVITEGFDSLDAAVGHIRQMAENSDAALKANATVESWKILSSDTRFEISADGKSVAQYEYSQETGLHIAADNPKLAQDHTSGVIQEEAEASVSNEKSLKISESEADLDEDFEEEFEMEFE